MPKLGWRGALGIVLSVALLVWSLWGIDLAAVSRTLASSNLFLFAASAAVATATFPLRALRWRIILAPIAPGLPFGPLWRSTAIGVMVNNVLPARAGELARAFAISREVPAVPFSASIASLAVDRVFDAVVLLLLMLGAMLAPGFPGARELGGQPIERWAALGTFVVLGLFAAMYAIVFFPKQLIGAFELFARRVAPRIEERGRGMLLAFASGLSVLRSPRRFLAVFAWTVLHWLVNALAFWLGFLAVGLDVPPGAALFLQGVIGFGVALPSAPGFFGTFELSATVGLAVYGVAKQAAVTWAIGFHLLSFVPITAIGAWYFARLGLHFRDIGATGDEASAVAPAASRERPVPIEREA